MEDPDEEREQCAGRGREGEEGGDESTMKGESNQPFDGNNHAHGHHACHHDAAEFE
jgi:hypothetical protein